MQVRTIVTDQTFVDRSQRLEEALKSNDCKAYCEEKMTNSANEQEKAEWSLLSVLFESVRSSPLSSTQLRLSSYSRVSTNLLFTIRRAHARSFWRTWASDPRKRTRRCWRYNNVLPPRLLSSMMNY